MDKRDDKEKLLDRIRKVLALSENNSNENERMSAAMRVHTMVAEFNKKFDTNMVIEDFNGPRDDMTCEMHMELDAEDWVRAISFQVCRLYFCVQFYTDAKDRPGKDRHYIAGEKHNVAVARLMFDYIRKTIERLADEASSKVRKDIMEYRTSFIYACAMRITKRIADRIDESRRGDAKDLHGYNLPVLASVYDQKLLEAKSFLDQQFGFSEGVKTTALAGKIMDHRGMRDGRKAGDDVGLETQVTTTKQQRLM